MKKKYFINRIYMGSRRSVMRFASFGQLTLIIESEVTVYNVKWFIDRVRKIYVCPKCKGEFEIKVIDTILNSENLEKGFRIHFCSTCSGKGPKNLKLTILKNGKEFDIFKAIEEHKKQ